MNRSLPRRVARAAIRALRTRRKARSDRLISGFYRNHVERDALCYDVGANWGLVSGALLRLGARVVAVEPDPDAALVLRFAFGWSPRLRLVRAALSDQVGTATLHRGEQSALSTISREFVEGVTAEEAARFWTGSVEVPVTTLDRLAAQYGRPQLLKIDAEGSEPSILRGMSFAPRFMQFEYIPRLHGGRECVERYHELAGAGAMGSLSVANAFERGEWMDLGRLIRTMDATTETCDVFLRSH